MAHLMKGTKIATEDGEIDVESIVQGTKLLTRADPAQYGEVTGDNFFTPATRPSLYGINDDMPFFSSSLCFYTTTGLKAIDPKAAQQENPWHEVGRLRVGHQLLRIAAEGKKYEQVLIRSIGDRSQNEEPVDVYGLRFKEGERSYHANGYLVAVNEPTDLKDIKRNIDSLLPRIGKERVKELEDFLGRFKNHGA